MLCDELFDFCFYRLCKPCFTLLLEILDASFEFFTVPNNTGQKFAISVCNSCSSAGVASPFFVSVFAFSVVAVSESLIGVPRGSESSSFSSWSRLVFCAAHSLSMSAAVLLVLLFYFFELKLVNGF